MDKQAYLNQLSASTRPIKPPRQNIFKNRLFQIAIGAIAILIIILSANTYLQGLNQKNKERIYVFSLHLDTVSDAIKSYQTYVKSSTLRSDSAALASILSNISRDVNNYIKDGMKIKNFKASHKTLVQKEKVTSEKLKDTFFNARINGVLDQVYAEKLASEISHIITDSSQIMKSHPKLKEVITSSKTSLSSLYENFNNFSETK